METELAQDDVPEEHPGPGSEGVSTQADGLESSEASIDAVDGLLDEVEDALTRLDDGTYGLCRSCGGPIDDLRLAESPVVQTCSSCV
jgi:RNA polymerase-binding transcription factor DksA